MKTLTDLQIVEAAKEKQALLERSISESKAVEKQHRELLEEAVYEQYLKENNAANKASLYLSKKENISSELLQTVLSQIFDGCLGNSICDNTDIDDRFNKSIVANFIQTEGVDVLLDRFSNATNFLSELAILVKEATEEAIEDIDMDAPEAHSIDSEIKDDLLDTIKGDETVEDISDRIKERVSRATDAFIQKNIVDKADIADIMHNTKEKIDGVRTNDAELDQEIKQEYTMAAKKMVRELSERPHSIFEQMVINMTEAILSNEGLKESFVLESGKLDMDKIVKRTVSYYTFLEMVSGLKMKNVDEEYIKEALSMN